MSNTVITWRTTKLGEAVYCWEVMECDALGHIRQLLRTGERPTRGQAMTVARSWWRFHNRVRDALNEVPCE